MQQFIESDDRRRLGDDAAADAANEEQVSPTSIYVSRRV
jgi:hypothetical protein